MTAPERLVVVVGTATEVGKTWVSARLLAGLRDAGHRVAARKPVQSYAPDDHGPTDAQVLAAATGEDPDEVCPADRAYPVAMAPPMAADVLGRHVPSIREVVAGLDWPPAVDVGLVETVGGIRSPLAADGDSRALVRALQPDVVLLVADAGLGVIDAVRSAHEALAGEPLLAFLNRFDPDDDLHRRNVEWLRRRDGIRAHTDLDALIGSV